MAPEHRVHSARFGRQEEFVFDLGPLEWTIVSIIAVLLFGNRLPEVVRSLKKGLDEFKRGRKDQDQSGEPSAT